VRILSKTDWLLNLTNFSLAPNADAFTMVLLESVSFGIKYIRFGSNQLLLTATQKVLID
jgi:hypothetical protein